MRSPRSRTFRSRRPSPATCLCACASPRSTASTCPSPAGYLKGMMEYRLPGRPREGLRRHRRRALEPGASRFAVGDRVFGVVSNPSPLSSPVIRRVLGRSTRGHEHRPTLPTGLDSAADRRARPRRQRRPSRPSTPIAPDIRRDSPGLRRHRAGRRPSPSSSSRRGEQPWSSPPPSRARTPTSSAKSRRVPHRRLHR